MIPPVWLHLLCGIPRRPTPDPSMGKKSIGGGGSLFHPKTKTLHMTTLPTAQLIINIPFHAFLFTEKYYIILLS